MIDRLTERLTGDPASAGNDHRALCGDPHVAALSCEIATLNRGTLREHQRPNIEKRDRTGWAGLAHIAPTTDDAAARAGYDDRVRVMHGNVPTPRLGIPGGAPDHGATPDAQVPSKELDIATLAPHGTRRGVERL